VLLPTGDAGDDSAASWENDFGLFHPIRRLRSNDLPAVLKSLSARDQKRFTGIVRLLGAVKSPDALLWAKLVESYTPLTRDIVSRYFPGLRPPIAQHDLEVIARFLKTRDQRDKAAAILSQLLTSELSKARIVMWRTRSGLVPAIYCPDAQSALFAYVLVLQQVAICPHCDSVFVKSRPDQQYCKIAHREAHRVARWRVGQRKQGTRTKG
jgi:hypothetical protein